MPAWLDSVCRWLNRTYAWQPQDVIPPCWVKHGGLAYEVAALAFAREDAYTAAGSSVVWHEQYDRFLTRMNKTLGKAATNAASAGTMTVRHGFQLAAWPTVKSGETGSEERVKEMAG